jgi:hypothetical protein
MPKRIPVQSIVLHREGKQVIPKVGEPFMFTEDELADIKQANPKAIRHVVNEDAMPVDGDVPIDMVDDEPVKGDPTDKKTGGKGGKAGKSEKSDEL